MAPAQRAESSEEQLEIDDEIEQSNGSDFINSKNGSEQPYSEDTAEGGPYNLNEESKLDKKNRLIRQQKIKARKARLRRL